jgi:hypothetical protein
MSAIEAAAPVRRKKTVTPKQPEANRRNAQKRTGPKTAEGKRRSFLNSLNYGFTPMHTDGSKLVS